MPDPRTCRSFACFAYWIAFHLLCAAALPPGPGSTPPGALSQGNPCQSGAVRGSDPPRCHAHSAADSAGFDTIAGVIHDLAAKQQRLSEYIDDCLGDDSLPIRDLARLLALHGQNASRLGRLLRDKRALSGEAADGISGAIAQALDELATEWGLEL
jgi:hypothetical protein